MKRALWLITIALLIFLVACGSGESSENNSNGNESVSLTLGLWNFDQAKVYEEVLEKFEEENPHIKVEIQTTPVEQYWTKLQTVASSNDIPDVFWMNGPNFINYASNDILLPLNDYIDNSDIDWDKFPESLKELYTYEDGKFAIPKDLDTIGLFYNKELFDEAGLSYPDESWGWDQFLDAAKKLTNKEDGVYGFAAELHNQLGYFNTIYQAGGYVVSDDLTQSGYDDPKTIEGLKIFTDMIHEYEVSPTLEQLTDSEPRQLFESGKVAMHFDGSWMAKVFQESMQDAVEVAVLPEGEHRATIIHGLGHAIAAQTDYPDEAWKLVEYLATEEVNLHFSESGLFLPTHEDVWDVWVDSVPEMNTQAFIDMIDYSVPYPVTENTAEWELLEEEYLTKAWTGQEDIEEMAKQLAEEMNKILE